MDSRWYENRQIFGFSFINLFVFYFVVISLMTIITFLSFLRRRPHFVSVLFVTVCRWFDYDKINNNNDNGTAVSEAGCTIGGVTLARQMIKCG